MKCPACFNLLTPYQAGQVAVDVCEGGCGGLWLDAFELQRLAADSTGDARFLLHITHDPNLQLDPGHKRDCPRCAGIKLKRRFFSPKRQIEVDECPGCGGLWLDAGELQKIEEELAEPKKPAFAQPSPKVPQLSMAAIRQLYRLHLERRGEL
jgi:uncharacterized protein